MSVPALLCRLGRSQDRGGLRLHVASFLLCRQGDGRLFIVEEIATRRKASDFQTRHLTGGLPRAFNAREISLGSLGSRSLPGRRPDLWDALHKSLSDCVGQRSGAPWLSE